MESVFRRVKAAVASNPEANLSALGIKLKKRISGTWSVCKCPICPDESGSCSITVEGFIKCHQCSRALDIFQWFGELNGKDPWEACQILANRFNVELTKVNLPKRGGFPARMTDKLLDFATSELWSSDKAEPCRKFLRSRGLGNNPNLLAEMGVGFLQGCLIFAQWTAKGAIRARYRTYTPGARPPWRHAGKSQERTVGFWPLSIWPHKDGVIWLMEGEWDTLTGWDRLMLQESGIFCYTFTGGAGQAPHSSDIPEQWWGKEVHIVYDNDTFQGPKWKDYVGPDPDDLAAMKIRRTMLLEKTVPAFLARDCKVFLRKVPIDPLTKWGGDFSDWVDDGGRNIDDLPCYEAEAVESIKAVPTEIPFPEIMDSIGELVRFRCVLSATDTEITIPELSEIKCDLNNRDCCGRCDVPKKWPKTFLNWGELQAERINMLLQHERQHDGYMAKHILGKPAQCPLVRLEVVPGRYRSGIRWTAAEDDRGDREDAHTLEVPIVSETHPPLGGEIEVTGKVYPFQGSAAVMATDLRAMDQLEVDLNAVSLQLQRHCPWRTNDVDLVDSYILRRAEDLAANVTKIYQRPYIHVAYDLLLHSALNFRLNDKLYRGWLDAVVFGDTRTGKSSAVRMLMQHTGLGHYLAVIESVSRAGLVMGSERDRKGRFGVRPGLWARWHRKLIVLDEFHMLAQNPGVEGHPMKWLQNARDEGRLHGVKMGQRALPGKVRFLCISNWFGGRKETYRFACEHLMGLYGPPECISRLDYALAIIDAPFPEKTEAEHVWTSDLCRALALRAWGQDVDDIVIDTEAAEHAADVVFGWQHQFHMDEVPLYTKEEKEFSLLRIAIACANLCFSHPEGDIAKVHVRKVHVEWAARWMLRSYESVEYGDYSRTALEQEELKKPFDAEVLLTVELGLNDPPEAMALLRVFVHPFSVQEVTSYTGDESYRTAKWINRGLRLNIFVKTRRGTYEMTRAGRKLVATILKVAEDYPDVYMDRYKKLEHWNMVGGGSQHKLTSLTSPIEDLEDEWADFNGPKNIVQGPQGGA